jgi:transcriptional regulator
MYEPHHFRIEDREEILAVIRANPFGLLITQGREGIEANPVPFTLAKDAGGRDVLRCHLARANPQWKAIGEGADALVVFQGGDHYVTPAWYATKKEHGKVVPTWNYVHVQVRGRAVAHDDLGFLADQVAALTDQHEAGRADPWRTTDAPAPFIAAHMRGIVGIEIAIEALTGKFKLSQNRPEADFKGVIEGLSGEKDTSGPTMAAFITQKSGTLLP